MSILELAFKRHKNWIDIVISFGCNRDTAEDIVQEMYIRIDRLVKSGTDIYYKDDINYYYIYLTLKTMFLDLKKKESRIYILSIDEVKNDLSYDQVIIDYDRHYEKFVEALNELYWYDQKVFEIIDNGTSVRELSRRTKISYASLYNTYRKVLKHLKSKI